MTDTLDQTIRKMQAEDGDVIVLTTSERLTKAAADHLRDMLATVVADLKVNAKVLVLDSGLDIKIIKTSQLQTIGDCGDPLTEVQRSIRNGTFGVKSAG